MTYRERWIRAVAHERTGVFGIGHRWTYAILDERGAERRMGTLDLLGELVPGTNHPGNDAYLCLDRAKAAFLTGSPDWVGYPSGAEEADPLATNVEAVTIDMLAFAMLLRVIKRPEAAQRYEDMAMDLRTEASEEAVEAARQVVGESLRGGAGSLNDVVVHHRNGSPDHYLSEWYYTLHQRLWDFSVGGKRFREAAPDRGHIPQSSFPNVRKRPSC